MTWIFNNKPISEDDIPASAVGFIYIIYCPDGTKYLGKKLLTKAAYKTVNGKRKKIRKPSDWQDYWSSSPLLLEEMAQSDLSLYKREIVLFCSSKGLLNYAEENLQHSLGVLHSTHWKNGNIRSRLYKSRIYGKPEIAKLAAIVRSHSLPPCE